MNTPIHFNKCIRLLYDNNCENENSSAYLNNLRILKILLTTFFQQLYNIYIIKTHSIRILTGFRNVEQFLLKHIILFQFQVNFRNI